MAKLTRRKLLCATAPLAAAPLGAKIVLGGEAEAAGHDHATHDHSSHRTTGVRTRDSARHGPRGDDR